MTPEQQNANGRKSVTGKDSQARMPVMRLMMPVTLVWVGAAPDVGGGLGNAVM
jgi:hypothetical protein